MIRLCLLAILLASSFQANAWFVYIPGSAIKSIGDSIDGETNRDMCLAPHANIGDIYPNGIVTAILGKSGKCQQPAFPILGKMDLTIKPFANSELSVSLTSSWERKESQVPQLATGMLFFAQLKQHPIELKIYSAVRPNVSSLKSKAESLQKTEILKLVSAKTSKVDEIQIDGKQALRYWIEGFYQDDLTKKRTFHTTIIENNEEIIFVRIVGESKSFSNQKATIDEIFERFSWVRQPMNSLDAKSEIEDARSSKEPHANLNIGEKVDHLPNTTSPKERLMSINQLFKEGLINEKEFESKKKEILNTL